MQTLRLWTKTTLHQCCTANYTIAICHWSIKQIDSSHTHSTARVKSWYNIWKAAQTLFRKPKFWWILVENFSQRKKKKCLKIENRTPTTVQKDMRTSIQTNKDRKQLEFPHASCVSDSELTKWSLTDKSVPKIKSEITAAAQSQQTSLTEAERE